MFILERRQSSQPLYHRNPPSISPPDLSYLLPYFTSFFYKYIVIHLLLKEGLDEVHVFRIISDVLREYTNLY